MKRMGFFSFGPWVGFGLHGHVKRRPLESTPLFVLTSSSISLEVDNGVSRLFRPAHPKIHAGLHLVR
jgi:hypothetical protein